MTDADSATEDSGDVTLDALVQRLGFDIEERKLELDQRRQFGLVHLVGQWVFLCLLVLCVTATIAALFMQGFGVIELPGAVMTAMLGGVFGGTGLGAGLRGMPKPWWAG